VIPPRGGLAVPYVAAIAACATVLVAAGVLDQRIAMTGRDDLSKIWAGPRALVLGRDPYDPLTWHRTAVDLGTFPPDTAVYLYPPWVAVALVPVALLPLPIATALWIGGGFTAAAIAVFALCRRSLPEVPYAYAAVGATLAISGPAISNILTGQWSFWLVAALGSTALAMRAERTATAGLAAVPMLAKPQLFLFAAPALALRALWPKPSRDRSRGIRAVAVASAASLALVLASALLVPSWWPAWPAHVGNAQLVPESVTIPGLLVRTIGVAGVPVAAVLLLASVVLALRVHPRSEAWLPVWLSLSVAATPYSNPYDLLVLIVPIVLASGALARSSRARSLTVLFAGAAILLVEGLFHDLALLNWAPLVPAAVFVLLIGALWPIRRETAGPGI
jgi:hypothetical protein